LRSTTTTTRSVRLAGLSFFSLPTPLATAHAGITSLGLEPDDDERAVREIGVKGMAVGERRERSGGDDWEAVKEARRTGVEEVEETGE
jgi:hypothetical protein